MSFIASFKGYMKLKKYTPASIVIYSEGKGYFVNFKNIISNLIDNNKQVIYVTSSIDDPVLNQETDLFIPIYIGNTFFLVLFFNYLHAKILLTTLPDIDTFHLKRSPNVTDMIYVHHSLVSMNMIYLPKAFEGYDTIFCAGFYHEKECREMEEEYNTKQKNMIHTGYPALDDLIEKYDKAEKVVNNRKIVTIAPSWQQDNIIDTCIIDMVNSLLNAGFLVKLRPHPQTIQKEYDKINRIINTYKNEQNFQLDISTGNFDSYITTDIMITDWSGTAYKYAFTTLKPVIFVNTPTKVRNNNYKNYKNIPVEIAWRSILGANVELENIADIGNIAKRLLNNNNFIDNLLEFREKNIYNIGHSGKICAEYIISKLK